MDATDQAQRDTYQAYGLRRELAVIKGNVPKVEEGVQQLGPATIFGGIAAILLGYYAYRAVLEAEGPK